jgi:hypothetical protein
MVRTYIAMCQREQLEDVWLRTAIRRGNLVEPSACATLQRREGGEVGTVFGRLLRLSWFTEARSVLK